MSLNLTRFTGETVDVFHQTKNYDWARIKLFLWNFIPLAYADNDTKKAVWSKIEVNNNGRPPRFSWRPIKSALAAQCSHRLLRNSNRDFLISILNIWSIELCAVNINFLFYTSSVKPDFHYTLYPIYCLCCVVISFTVSCKCLVSSPLRHSSTYRYNIHRFFLPTRTPLRLLFTKYFNCT